MGVDLHLINEVWYGLREATPRDDHTDPDLRNHLGYYTVMAMGIYLLRNPDVAKKFVEQAWTDDPAEPE